MPTCANTSTAIATSTAAEASTSRVVAGAGASGRRRHRPAATDAATAPSTMLAGTSAYSPRATWKPAASSTVRARAAPASGVSRGATLVSAGRISPIPPSTSQTPMRTISGCGTAAYQATARGAAAYSVPSSSSTLPKPLPAKKHPHSTPLSVNHEVRTWTLPFVAMACLLLLPYR